MTTYLLNVRKIGADDISWGLATLNYTDYNGVNRHMPQVNAFVVPYTTTESVGEALDAIVDAQLDIIVVDSVAEFTAALTTLGSNTGTIYLKRGTYTLTSDPAVPANVRLWFENGAVINASNTTVTISGPILASLSQIFTWTGTGDFDISDSPTNTVYLEWWGAVTGTSNDCTDAINMCFASTSGQMIQLLKGDYRITSAITYESAYRTLNIRGQGKVASRFYIDLGGAGTGFTFGTPGSLTGFTVNFEDFSFIGPVSCCATGVKYYLVIPMSQRRVAYFMGASGYGFECHGCIHVSMTEIYVSYIPGGSGPAGGAYLAKDTGSGYDNTVWTFDFHAHGSNSPGGAFSLPALKVESLAVANLSGVIEGYTVPLEVGGVSTVANASMINFQGLYVEGAGTEATFTNTHYCSLTSCLFNDATLSLVFDGCTDWNIDNCFLVDAYVRANSRGIRLGANCMWYGKRIFDDGHGTIAIAESKGTMVTGNDKQNILYNSSLTRWNATSPDGFTDGGFTTTFTQCGIGLGDTTRHSSPYSVMATTTLAIGSLNAALDANQLARVIGRQVTWCVWAYCPVGETLTYIIPELTITLPAWANAHDYLVGEGYVDGTGFHWTVVEAGTSDAVEPTWPVAPTSSDRVTDGTVIWGYRDDGYVGGRYLPADQGSWKSVGISRYVPRNATAVTVDVLIYRDVTDCSVYLAEPSVTIGSVGNSALVANSGETLSFMQIGANRISYGTAVPAAGWCQQGDIVWRTDATAAQSPGWICTTSGVGGVGAVWKAMANVAA